MDEFEIESSVIKADKRLKGAWTVKITHSKWHWSGHYGWMWCGPWRPWTKLFEWWYNGGSIMDLIKLTNGGIMDLKLTNEQAEWLKATISAILDNNHWGRGSLDSDHKEHAETIYKKLEQKLKKGKW